MQFVGAEYRETPTTLGVADTLNVPVPAGVASGDIIVALGAYGQGSTPSSVGPSDMIGWTEVGDRTAGIPSAYNTVYTRTAGAAESSYDFVKIDAGSTRAASVNLIVLRGVTDAGVVRALDTTASVIFPSAGSGNGAAIRWWSNRLDSAAALTTVSGLTFINEGGAGAFQEAFYDIVSSGATEIDTGYTAASGVASETLFFSEGVTTSPTITNINTNNEFTPGEANTLNGENLSETGGSIVIDGETQTITNRTATAITFTGVRGGNPYNTDLTLTYTDANSNTVTQTVQQVPAVGFAVTAASPNTTDPASLWSGLVDTSTGNPVTVVDGDQALVTDPNNLGNLAVTPAGEISADTEGNFVVQFWRASEGVWGGDQTVTFTASAGGLTDIELKKRQNKRRRYTANLFGAWRNRFIGGQDE